MDISMKKFYDTKMEDCSDGMHEPCVLHIKESLRWSPIFRLESFSH